MTDYTVKWEINIEADSPEEAAMMALEIQRDPESQATFFDAEVQYPDGTVLTWPVDLGHQPLIRCEQHHNALIVCNRLIEAYTKASEDFGSGGSVDWSDIDDAHSLAHVTADHCEAVEQIQQELFGGQFTFDNAPALSQIIDHSKTGDQQ